MELYKIITLVMLLNVAGGMTTTFADPNSTWSTWYDADNQPINEINEVANTGTASLTDDDQIITERNENILDDLGIISAAIIVGKILWGILKIILMGGIVTMLKQAKYMSTGPQLLQIISMFVILFYSMLYAWAGLKIYAWTRKAGDQS